MTCKCDYYEKGTDLLMAPGMLEYARNPQNFKEDENGVVLLTPGVKDFVYCPWCGEKLGVYK